MSPENGLLNGKKVGSSHLLSFKQHKIISKRLLLSHLCKKKKKKFTLHALLLYSRAVNLFQLNTSVSFTGKPDLISVIIFSKCTVQNCHALCLR